MTRITVIGGGLIGLGTALALRSRLPDATFQVLEKEPGWGCHQSSHNSGVLHAGLYYRPGSAKARLAVAGIRLMTDWCVQHQIPHEMCGKLVVATGPEQLPHLERLWANGQTNGLRGLQRLDAAGIREREPHAAGIAAILVPEEGIVDYPAVVVSLTKELAAAGVDLRCRHSLLRARRRQGVWHLDTDQGEYPADFLVSCAGLHADWVARRCGARPASRIIPFRGEYFSLKPERVHLVKHLIYPVPDPEYPFLGVHFTRRIGGGVEAGPNAVLALARQGYGWRNIHPADLAGALAYPGLWRFLVRHRRMAFAEVRRSLSRRLFTASLARLVPDIRVQDLGTGGSGVRAQAMGADGTLHQDFDWIEQEGALHLLNAPSPGATASLAIGREIAARVAARLR